MNRVALITGGSRGLGATLAAHLAGTGYDLILTARDAAALEAAARPLRHYRGQVGTVAGDVSDPAHREELGRTAAEFGRLDILINNASDLGATPLPRLLDYPLDRLQQVLAVNLLAPLALTQQLYPLLAANGGVIINVSSDAALGGYPGWGGYGASKAALDLVSLTLANELAASGIAVVSVDPGDLRTNMHQAAYPGEDISDRPLPDTTIPFWTWLFGQPRALVNGHRYRAQADVWEVAA
jgi:NAD(P)-dependent dehydrogenase (short-subunit alcohol dehydrogenase family)